MKWILVDNQRKIKKNINKTNCDEQQQKKEKITEKELKNIAACKINLKKRILKKKNCFDTIENIKMNVYMCVCFFSVLVYIIYPFLYMLNERNEKADKQFKRDISDVK